MPPTLLFDISKLDLNKVEYPIEVIREYNPQRGDMEHINGFVYLNYDHGVGFKDVRADEFWVPGHLPDRPLLPGVIMIEAAAQTSSFITKCGMKWPGFIGFGGVDKVKFRQQVVPGQRIYFLSKMTWNRHKRVGSMVQGIVDGNLVFEAEITGVVF